MFRLTPEEAKSLRGRKLRPTSRGARLTIAVVEHNVARNNPPPAEPTRNLKKWRSQIVISSVF